MTFSRRKKLREKGDTPDVYQYDRMSEKLRRQLVMKMECLAEIKYARDLDGRSIYRFIVKFMRQELGVFELADRGYNVSAHDQQEFTTWFLSERDLDHVLTALETYARACQGAAIWTDAERERRDGLIEDINALMLEDCFGFQFTDGQIIEISSEFIHKEVVVPVLGLLSDSKYATVNQEFRQAHSEFRARQYDDCIHDCCNAFESMMKIIASEHGWTEINENSTASALVKALFDHNFIPAYLQQEFTGLRTILEGGINTVRNKTAGHGQGTTPRVIDKQVAEFQLNQTAAVLKLLGEYSR